MTYPGSLVKVYGFIEPVRCRQDSEGMPLIFDFESNPKTRQIRLLDGRLAGKLHDKLEHGAAHIMLEFVLSAAAPENTIKFCIIVPPSSSYCSYFYGLLFLL